MRVLKGLVAICSALVPHRWPQEYSGSDSWHMRDFSVPGIGACKALGSLEPLGPLGRGGGGAGGGVGYMHL